ncbi:MAG: RDD family protein [Bacilli bacterium]|jgi:hypothetical protein|nr:RDD family protein [Bacilli bacterium]
MDKTTYFSKAEPAKPTRKLAAYFLDFLIALIMMIGLFGIEELIFNNTPAAASDRQAINEVYQEMRDLTLSSKMAQADSNGRLLGQNDIVLNYVYGATYESLKRNNDPTISESLYEGYKRVDSSNDNCFYYYVNFKTENKEGYTASSQESSGLSFYRQSLALLSQEDYFVPVEESEYPYLTLDIAKTINEYFINDSYSIGYNAFRRLSQAYASLLKDGVKDIQSNYEPFLALQRRYDEKSAQIYNGKTIELVVAYLVALAIYYVLLPVLLKDGKTLSFKMMSMGVVNHRNERLSWYNYLIKFVMNALESLSLIAITGLVFFGVSALELVGRNLFGSVSFLSIAIFSFFVMFVDFMISFAMRNTSQTLTELASMEIVKDGKMFNTVKKKDLV